jgi:predicted RNA-binding protein with PUA-like domain
MSSKKATKKRKVDEIAVSASDGVNNNIAVPVRGNKPRQYADSPHWLMKNEPPYSLYALQHLDRQREAWVGVRSTEARNIMLFDMKLEQQIFYYEASIANPHISGVAKIASQPYPDPTAIDSKHKYYDPAHNDPSKPHWWLVDVEFVRLFKRPIYLAELKHYEQLKDLVMLKKFRLSISPLSQQQWDFILSLEDQPIKAEIKAKLKPDRKNQQIIPAEEEEESSHKEEKRSQNTKKKTEKVKNGDSNNHNLVKPKAKKTRRQQ